MDGLAIRSKPLRKTVSQLLYVKFIHSLSKHLFSVSYVLAVKDARMKDIVLWGNR